jgi:acetylornithine/LysW-gamma-L-lysine aminotransferase
MYGDKKMSEDKIIQSEQIHMAPLYWKRDLMITHGIGAYLFDKDGKTYIDCTSNYGVAITGHCHPRVVEAIQNQSNKLLSCHGTYYNEARSTFLEKLNALTPQNLSQSYLSNSGTEAVEFALKLARKATGRTGIIAMMNGFHGKTMGSLSATWKKKYRKPFLPLVPGFKHVPFGREDRLHDALSNDIAAVIVEPIQGEGGINLPPEGYLNAIRDLCDDNETLLILDEIQTGIGRTGKFLAIEHWRVEPDIVCLSKGVASGLPLGVTMATREVMNKMKMGEHSSTFGGGPVPCAAGSATLDVIRDEKLMENASTLGSYILEELEALREYKSIRDVRGKGMMIAIELKFDALNIIKKCQNQGVLILDAGRNILRLLPPLVMNKEQACHVVHVIYDIIEKDEASRLLS